MRIPGPWGRIARLLLLSWLTAAVVPAGCGGPSPEEVLKAVELGDKYAVDGKHKKAIAAYSRAVTIDPDCKKAYVCRGMSYNESGQSKKALKDFSKAIKLDPSDSYPYEQRAHIYRTVLHDEAKASADDERAEAIRQKRWGDLQKLRKRKKKR